MHSGISANFIGYVIPVQNQDLKNIVAIPFTTSNRNLKTFLEIYPDQPNSDRFHFCSILAPCHKGRSWHPVSQKMPCGLERS